MIRGVEPVNPESNRPYVSGAAIQEKLRFSYNAHTQTFEPMEESSKNNGHMEKVEGQIEHLPVPVDRTSPLYLKTVVSRNRPTGAPIQSNTKGVKEFVAGNSALYSSFISSITKAQRTI